MADAFGCRDGFCGSDRSGDLKLDKRCFDV